MSEKLARQLFHEAQQFNATLKDTGWSANQSVSVIGSKSPVDLFASEERPLVVGLFGGTGVGKSSLLNRLAGAEIARTGVVRPTSMEITAYLHQDVQLDTLPDHFVADRFSDNRHTNAHLSDVMWVDMPDFDSDETQNKDQVLQWLPHIDLLIYVVTPERYKDAEGWRMMLENGYQHAWLFVINQWDKAEPIQYQDFTHMLESAGFQTPEVFRTVCNAAHADDQFNELVEVIASLAKRNVISHLQERGWIRRLSTVQSKLKAESQYLAIDASKKLDESFAHRWHEFENAATAHLDAPFKTYSALFSEKKTNAVTTVFKSLGGKEAVTEVAGNIALRSDASELWDDWLSIRMTDSVQQFNLAGSEHGVPAAVMSMKNDMSSIDARAIITQHLKQAVETTIESPGTQWQRLVAKLAGILKIALPLLALAWVSWRVINGFIAGAEDRAAYVGLDFLTNGLLLAGLGWLIPMMVGKLFVPSLPDSIYRELHGGLRTGLAEVEQQVQLKLVEINDARLEHAANAAHIDQRIEQFIASADQADPSLDRVLMSSPDPL